MLEASLELYVPQNEHIHIKTFRIERDAIIKEVHGATPTGAVILFVQKKLNKYNIR